MKERTHPPTDSRHHGDTKGAAHAQATALRAVHLVSLPALGQAGAAHPTHLTPAFQSPSSEESIRRALKEHRAERQRGWRPRFARLSLGASWGCLWLPGCLHRQGSPPTAHPPAWLVCRPRRLGASLDARHLRGRGKEGTIGASPAARRPEAPALYRPKSTHQQRSSQVGHALEPALMSQCLYAIAYAARSQGPWGSRVVRDSPHTLARERAADEPRTDEKTTAMPVAYEPLHQLRVARAPSTYSAGAEALPGHQAHSAHARRGGTAVRMPWPYTSWHQRYPCTVRAEAYRGARPGLPARHR